MFRPWLQVHLHPLPSSSRISETDPKFMSIIVGDIKSSRASSRHRLRLGLHTVPYYGYGRTKYGRIQVYFWHTHTVQGFEQTTNGTVRHKIRYLRPYIWSYGSYPCFLEPSPHDIYLIIIILLFTLYTVEAGCWVALAATPSAIGCCGVRLAQPITY